MIKSPKKPLDESQLVQDWINGVKWEALRKNYNCRTEIIKETVKKLNLPSRHCGPVPAIRLNSFLEENKKRLQLVINDYVNGKQLHDIMKKYHIGYETFRNVVKPYHDLRKKSMREALVRRNREVKRKTGNIRK
jgi:Mor family transcriptional regulator